jgi:hypothetical protein
MATRFCKQEKCSLRGTGMCNPCPECRAKPDYVTEEYCVTCWACEHDLGFVRGNAKKEVEQEIGVMIIEKINGE